jgi:hypothetical protein
VQLRPLIDVCIFVYGRLADLGIAQSLVEADCPNRLGICPKHDLTEASIRCSPLYVSKERRTHAPSLEVGQHVHSIYKANAAISRLERSDSDGNTFQIVAIEVFPLGLAYQLVNN